MAPDHVPGSALNVCPSCFVPIIVGATVFVKVPVVVKDIVLLLLIVAELSLDTTLTIA